MKRFVSAVLTVFLLASFCGSALAEGFAVEDGRLIYIMKDGQKAESRIIGTFLFGKDTYYTSGNAELDAYVGGIVEKVTDDSMTQEEKLSALYDYMLIYCGYRMGNIYESGETGWEISEAVDMMKRENRGNCYGFAALFRELARGIGYPAEAYSGTVVSDKENGEDTPHGWVEIIIDGVNYIFDPEMDYMQQTYNYMIEADSEKAERWGYRREIY